MAKQTVTVTNNGAGPLTLSSTYIEPSSAPLWVGNGAFNPDGQLTREQAATMLSRLAAVAGQPMPSHAPTFADNASISSWAYDAVGQVQADGIMGGVGNNTFAPQAVYSREQGIVTMYRLFEQLRTAA